MSLKTKHLSNGKKDRLQSQSALIYLLGRLIMRYIILILFIAATAHSQTSTSTVTNRPEFHPMFINTTDTTHITDGRWRIGIVEGGKYVNLMFNELTEDGWSASVWDIIEPDPWTTHPGWFIYVESESRAWAYDGDRLLILRTETPNKTATYTSWFPCAVPSEVFSHLSEAAKKDVKK